LPPTTRRASGPESALSACPTVFAQDDEGYVALLDASPDDSLRAQVEDAAESCPSGAIEVSD
jgi:ferredoxin